MAAGLGFKTFTSGEVLTAADTNGYLMQGVMVFANASARSAAITAPTEGQYSYLKDTNSTEYYDGSAWVAGVEGDISGVTAGVGISGGGTSGTVTVTNSMATTITTKGDLVPGTGSGTFARLAVGNNGETLVADSSTSTGLRYTAGTVQENPILNAACEIAQRGTTALASNAATNQFMTDRWQVFRAVAGGTFSRQNTSDTTNLPNVRYCTRAARDSGNTATNAIFTWQNLETVNTIPFVGKTVTMSFYARAGANYSPTSSLLQVRLATGTGTDQNYINGYTGAGNPIASTATLTTTWQRFTYTGTIPTTVTEMAPVIYAEPTGTAGANDYYEVTAWQIDVGSVALPFRTYAATIQGELAACQRYYYRAGGASTYEAFANGQATSTTVAKCLLRLPVTMRVSPTSIEYSTVGVADGYSAPISAVVTLGAASPNVQEIAGTVASGLTQNRAYYLSANNSTNAYIGVSAEL